MSYLEPIDRKLLSVMQDAFPLVPRPFEAISSTIGITESEVIRRARDLKAQGIIRRVRAVFNSKRLGYQSGLAAMQVPPKRLGAVANSVSKHSGVSHNYGREHRYNLWFVLTIPNSEDMQREIDSLAQSARATNAILLPSIRTFKIKVRLDFSDEQCRVQSEQGDIQEARSLDLAEAIALSTSEINVIRSLQEDLPLIPEPFLELSHSIGLDAEGFIEIAKMLKDRGIMRRYTAVVNHYKVGVGANAMSCWIVPSSKVEHVGTTMAGFPYVSHLYERRTNPDWPYNIYAMIHASSRDECNEFASRMADASGARDYELLHSTKEYKKEGTKYFA